MTKQTRYNTTVLTCYFEALMQIRYNPKINTSNKLLRKKQEFFFWNQRKKRGKMKEFMTCIYMGKHHAPFSSAFFFSLFLLFLFQLAHGWIFFFFFLSYFLSPTLSQSLGYCVCVYYRDKRPTLYKTIQIKSSFSLVFVWWFTHSCSLSISGVVGKADSSPTFFFSLKHMSNVRVHQ